MVSPVRPRDRRRRSRPVHHHARRAVGRRHLAAGAAVRHAPATCRRHQPEVGHTPGSCRGRGSASECEHEAAGAQPAHGDVGALQARMRARTADDEDLPSPRRPPALRPSTVRHRHRGRAPARGERRSKEIRQVVSLSSSRCCSPRRRHAPPPRAAAPGRCRPGASSLSRGRGAGHLHPGRKCQLVRGRRGQLANLEQELCATHKRVRRKSASWTRPRGAHHRLTSRSGAPERNAPSQIVEADSCSARARKACGSASGWNFLIAVSAAIFMLLLEVTL